MRVSPNPVDSGLLGHRVLEVSEVVDGEQLATADAEWTAGGEPFLVVLRLPADRLDLIQRAEDLGFRYSECQLQLRQRLAGRPRPPARGFEHFEVRTEGDLQAVLSLVGTLDWLDRLSLDPAFGPDIARRRYQAYVRRSFGAEDETVLALRDLSSTRIVAFSSLRRVSPTEACALLGGVSPEFQRTGLAVIHDEFGRNYLLDHGIHVVTTAISAVHHAVVHSHLRHMGFRVTRTWVVLRKSHA